jgi:SAM-dependent methyltransferase
MTIVAEDWDQLAPPEEFIRKEVPRIASIDVPTCPVCISPRFHQHAVGFDYELLTCSNPWRFVRCADCGHVWLNPRPADSELGVIYPPSYYAYNYETLINPIARRGKEALDALKIRGILRHVARTPRSYLDVGCGNGRFLRQLEKAGIPRRSLYGLELSPSTVDGLVAEGFQVFCERAEDCESIPERSIDLATMFHVLEHVADPRAVLTKISSWLSPTGVLAIETPNSDSMDARLFQDTYWGGYHIPRHWHIFSSATLRRQIEDCGLRVIGTAYQTGHSFWMYSFHHVLRFNRRAPQPGLSKLFDPMTGLPMLVAFTGFDKLRGALGQRTSAVLMLATRA